MVGLSLGAVLTDSRTAHGLSLQEVAERAGCSPAYVHKLESGRVRTPSPRVLAGLAEALGLTYQDLMAAAGYEPAGESRPNSRPGAVKRYSNAHIVELLEAIQADLEELKTRVGAQSSKR